MILTEGARVRLRMMRREDADELYALLSDEAVMRWLEPPFNRAQAERFLEQAGLSDPPLIYAAESAEGEFLLSATPSTTTMTSTAGSSAGCSSLPFGTRAMRTK